MNSIKTQADKTEYECQYCNQTFVYEDRYLKHKCKSMIRNEQFRSLTGQAAWSFFQKWMRFQKKQVPPISAFIDSKYFTAFYKFADFVKSTELTESTLFIHLMVSQKIHPSIWSNEEIYKMYLEHLMYDIPPLKQVEITVNTMLRLTEQFNCKLEELFEVLPLSEVCHLISQQKLSPWILLHSKKFLLAIEEADVIDIESLAILIPDMWWKIKFSRSPQIVKLVKKCVKELNI